MNSRDEDGDLDVSKLLDKIAKDRKPKKDTLKKNYHTAKQSDKVPTVKVPYNQNLSGYMPQTVLSNHSFVQPNLSNFPAIPPQFANTPVNVSVNPSLGPPPLTTLPFNQMPPPSNFLPPHNLGFPPPPPPPPPHIQASFQANYSGSSLNHNNNSGFSSNVNFSPLNTVLPAQVPTIPGQTFNFDCNSLNSRQKEDENFYSLNNSNSAAKSTLPLPPPPPPPLSAHPLQLKTPLAAKESESNISSDVTISQTEKHMHVHLDDIHLPNVPPPPPSPVSSEHHRKSQEPNKPQPKTSKKSKHSDEDFRPLFKRNVKKLDSKRLRGEKSLRSKPYRECSRSPVYSEGLSDSSYRSQKSESKRRRSHDDWSAKRPSSISKLSDDELQRKINALRRKCNPSPIRDYPPSEEDCKLARGQSFNPRGGGPRFFPPFFPQRPNFRAPFVPRPGFTGGGRPFKPRGFNGRFPITPMRAPGCPERLEGIGVPPSFAESTILPYSEGHSFISSNFEDENQYVTPHLYPVYTDDVVSFDKENESSEERSSRPSKQPENKRTRESSKKLKSKKYYNEGNSNNTMRFTTIAKDVKRTKEIRRTKELKNVKEKTASTLKKEKVNYDDLEPGECISSSDEFSECEGLDEEMDASDTVAENNYESGRISNNSSSVSFSNNLRRSNVQVRKYSSSSSSSESSSESSTSSSSSSSSTSSSEDASSDSELYDRRNTYYSDNNSLPRNSSFNFLDAPSPLPHVPLNVQELEKNDLEIQTCRADLSNKTETSVSHVNVDQSNETNSKTTRLTGDVVLCEAAGDRTVMNCDIENESLKHCNSSSDGSKFLDNNANESIPPQSYDRNINSQRDINFGRGNVENSLPPIPIPTFDEYKRQNRAGSLSPNDSLEFEEYCLLASTHELLSASKSIFKSPSSPKINSKKVYEKPIIKVERDARKLNPSRLKSTKKFPENSPVKRNKLDLDSRIKQIIEKPDTSLPNSNNDMKDYIYNHKTMRLSSHPPSPFRSRRAYHFWYRETYYFRKENPLSKEFFDPTIPRKVQQAKIIKVYSPETEEIMNRPFKPELLELFKKESNDSKESVNTPLDGGNLRKVSAGDSNGPDSVDERRREIGRFTEKQRDNAGDVRFKNKDNLKNETTEDQRQHCTTSRDELIQLVMRKFMEEIRDSLLEKLTEDIVSERRAD